MKSSFLSVNWLDLGQGALTAAITAILGTLGIILYQGRLPTLLELKVAGVAALVAGFSYITKNFFKDTNAAAVKRVEKAGGAVIENTSYNSDFKTEK